MNITNHEDRKQWANQKLHEFALELQEKRRITYGEAIRLAGEQAPLLLEWANENPRNPVLTSSVVLDKKVREVMQDKKLSYRDAFNLVIKENPGLYEKIRKELLDNTPPEMVGR